MRKSGYYGDMTIANVYITIGILIIAGLLVAALSRSKIEKISPKVIYFYTMSFISLILVANGVGTFISMIADLIVSLGEFNIDIKKAFLTFSSILIAAGPSFYFHWKNVYKGLGHSEEEKILWPYYKYLVLGISAAASLIFVGTLFYQVMSSILGISEFSWAKFNTVLGYGIIGIAIWLYHWFLKIDFK